MSYFVDRLHEVSRLVRGAERLSLERLDFNRLIRAVVDERRPLLEQAGIVLNGEMPETPIWVQGDVNRLTQVVHSLLENAAKFTERDGQIMVRLQLDPDSRRAVLSVKDTGMGIEPALLNTLWEPFSPAYRSLDGAAPARTGDCPRRGRVARGETQLSRGRAGPEFTIRPSRSHGPHAVLFRSLRGERACWSWKTIATRDSLSCSLGHEVRVA